MSGVPFLQSYNGGIVRNLECAIGLLDDLENKVKCDSDYQLGDTVREQATVFLEHLMKNKSTIITRL